MSTTADPPDKDKDTAKEQREKEKAKEKNKTEEKAADDLTLPFSEAQLIIILILGLIAAGVLFYFLITYFNRQANFVQVIITTGAATILNYGTKAVLTADAILSGSIDFLTVIWADINVLLTQIVDSFAQIMSTLGQLVLDAVSLMASAFNRRLNYFATSITNFFNSVFQPVITIVNLTIGTILQLVAYLVGTFDLSDCP